jgi:hypothetical protein
MLDIDTAPRIEGREFAKIATGPVAVKYDLSSAH